MRALLYNTGIIVNDNVVYTWESLRLEPVSLPQKLFHFVIEQNIHVHGTSNFYLSVLKTDVNPQTKENSHKKRCVIVGIT